MKMCLCKDAFWWFNIELNDQYLGGKRLCGTSGQREREEEEMNLGMRETPENMEWKQEVQEGREVKSHMQNID